MHVTGGVHEVRGSATDSSMRTSATNTRALVPNLLSGYTVIRWCVVMVFQKPSLLYLLSPRLHALGSHMPTMQYLEREKEAEVLVGTREIRTSVPRRSSRLMAIVLGLVVLIHPLAMSGNAHGQLGTPIVPNASLVTAEVLRYSILSSSLLDIEPEQTLYSLTLAVLVSEQVDARTISVVKVGDVLEVFSKEELCPNLFKRTIRGTVRLVADEWGQRYWIQEIHVLPAKEEGVGEESGMGTLSRRGEGLEEKGGARQWASPTA